MGGQEWGYLEDVESSWLETWRTESSLKSWMTFFDPKIKYSERFMLISLLEVCQEWGVKNGGTLRTLRVPDQRLGGQGHPWCHVWSCLTPRKIPWKFHGDIFIRSVSRMEGPSWGYLEDVEGSWPETWMTESSLMSWMILFDPKEYTLKVSCWYLY